MKFFVSIACLVWLFTSINIDDFYLYVNKLNYKSLFIYIFLINILFFLGGIRWRYLINGACNKTYVSIAQSSVLSLIGNFFNQILPGQVGGDIVRGFLLYRGTFDSELAVITTLLDRGMGFLSLIVLTIFLFPFIPNSIEFSIEFFIYMIISTIILIILLFTWRPYRINNFFSKVYKYLDILLADPRLLFITVSISIIIHLLTVAVLYMIAIDVGVNVSYFTLLILLPLMYIVTSLPISIGGIGVRESIFVLFLGLYHVSEGAAIYISLAWYFSVLIAALPGGVLFVLWRTTHLKQEVEVDVNT